MKTLIAKFNLPMITDFDLIQYIASEGYKLTGNKFTVEFNGSKGYLSHITIHCEGFQPERNNIIWLDNLLTKKRTLKSKIISVFYNEENGISIEPVTTVNPTGRL